MKSCFSYAIVSDSWTMEVGRISVMLRARTAVWPGHLYEPKTVAFLSGMSTRSRLVYF
jgi:hypothetical protein